MPAGRKLANERRRSRWTHSQTANEDVDIRYPIREFELEPPKQ